MLTQSRTRPTLVPSENTSVLFVTYCLGHAWLMLLASAVYWDDWVLYKVPAATILQTFQEAGAMFNWAGYLHLLMQKAGPWTYRITVFFLMFGAGICLDRILVRHHQVPDAVRFVIVLLFLTLPFNMARASMITMPYSLCYFAFFLAWLLMTKHKVASCALFFISFNIPSLIVFYILPILDSALQNRALQSHRSIWKFTTKYAVFLSLPFIFWSVKQTWFKPSGLYADYNQHFDFRNIDDAIKSQLHDMTSVGIDPGLFLAGLVIASILLRDLKLPNANVGLSCKLIVAGVIAIVAACFPYWILGLVPSFSDWQSRHQLLMPLGAAMLLTGTLTALPNQIARWMALALVAASTSISVESYLALYHDWGKQKHIITLLRQSSKIKAADIVIFQDNTEDINALGRKYRFYEWNGLMSEAFGDEKRLGLSASEFQQFQTGNLPKYWKAASMYRCGEFEDGKSLEVVSATLQPVDVPHNGDSCATMRKSLKLEVRGAVASGTR
jgi:hypothetical protein